MLPGVRFGWGLRSEWDCATWVCSLEGGSYGGRETFSAPPAPIGPEARRGRMARSQADNPFENQTACETISHHEHQHHCTTCHYLVLKGRNDEEPSPGIDSGREPYDLNRYALLPRMSGMPSPKSVLLERIAQKWLLI